ncbi:MAG: HigA family addiction module antitoxin [Betaproteobacteria bacterium]|nr:HigA family addiction module antitoxin [Betaproteobacteria bacterium]
MHRLFCKQPLGIFSRRPTHPGKMLQNYFLEPSGLTQGELAQRLGISRRRVNELLNARRGITADTALRLAAYFNTDPILWTAWQASYDLYHAWKVLRSMDDFTN